ncbi:carboxypeptidase-like regulatory domain-containing protein [Lutimonas saemankumensis]|uniref:carboxypeptidase-like regulatory domain-containing protein n=1 Tax=Lutimonas saemankumensis TaxID=483016 RepID=UPI001CD65DE7|nr:carboxypeptidase-like regulatory domain-containing protein [Lutimonas saemankumensis]MCA0932797.1 carboxypeptidase-like regulatory domain-containing protein [Lutimonas saemankumensis]
MKNLFLIFLFLTGWAACAQGVVVKGNVLDGDFNNEPLAFASIKVKGLGIHAETSLSGNFELELLEGNYDLVIEFIGYEPVEIRNIEVNEEKVILKPVILKARGPEYDLASAFKGMSSSSSDE